MEPAHHEVHVSLLWTLLQRQCAHAGKILAMRDISVRQSELLPLILQPLTASAVAAASHRPREEQLPAEEGLAASLPQSSTARAEAIEQAAPAIERLKVFRPALSDGVQALRFV